MKLNWCLTTTIRHATVYMAWNWGIKRGRERAKSLKSSGNGRVVVERFLRRKSAEQARLRFIGDLSFFAGSKGLKIGPVWMYADVEFCPA